jgi:hypothetical protein
MLRRLPPALTVALALLAVPAVAQETVTVKPPERFATKIDRINARAEGPVLLPSRMTVEATRLYTSGGTTRGGWDLELAAARNCGGANACFVATFTAEAGGAPAGRRRVALSDGRTGWFTPTGCGASCSPPQMQWRERGMVFTIQARVGTQSTERRELIRLANSAIINGPRS